MTNTVYENNLNDLGYLAGVMLFKVREAGPAGGFDRADVAFDQADEVDGLVDAGLVEEVVYARYPRATRFFLTPEGERVIREMLES